MDNQDDINNEYLESIRERNKHLKKLSESFTDERVDFQGKFDLLRPIIDALIQDNEQLLKRNIELREYVNDVVDAMLGK